MNELFENIRTAIESVPVERLPRILGMLAEISETCRARLSTPAPAQQPDELLTVREAALRMRCSTATLYKTNYPFVKRLGRKRLFSSAGITEYLARQK